MSEGLLIVGFVRGAHGVTGEFKVESASGCYEHIAALKEVTLRNGSDSKKCSVQSAKIGCAALYMKVAEINSPEEVVKYKGWGLEVPRKYAHPLQQDEWYIEDLKNCSLIWSGDGTADENAPTQIVGTITDVLEGGAGFLLEVSLSESCTVLADDVKRTASGKARTALVPFSFKYVRDVDIEHKTVRLMHLWILE
mgnify:FL=1